MKEKTAKQLLQLSEDEYNIFAREFSDTRPFFWRELEYLKEFIKNGDRVLDIGCGNGRLLHLLRGKQASYTGIDSSARLIELAKKFQGDKGIFIQANALSIPFKNKSFDTVFGVAVFHHIPSKKYREKFIKEAERVLKDNGKLILTVWNVWQWRFLKIHSIHILDKILGRSDLDFGDIMLSFGQTSRKRYIHAFRKKELKQLLQKNGFWIRDTKTIKRKSGYSNVVIVAKKNSCSSPACR